MPPTHLGKSAKKRLQLIRTTQKSTKIAAAFRTFVRIAKSIFDSSSFIQGGGDAKQETKARSRYAPQPWSNRCSGV